MRIDGTRYPSIIENGSISRSRGETRRTLLAYLPGNELAAGDVRRWINKYMGIVTAKVMFWRINPNMTRLPKVSKSTDLCCESKGA
jgi:hypothetical protein